MPCVMFSILDFEAAKRSTRFTADRKRVQVLTGPATSVNDIKSEVPGRVAEVHVSVGSQVQSGDELVVLESMKMLMPVTAPSGGTVQAVAVAVDDSVQEGDLLVQIQVQG